MLMTRATTKTFTQRHVPQRITKRRVRPKNVHPLARRNPTVRHKDSHRSRVIEIASSNPTNHVRIVEAIVLGVYIVSKRLHHGRFSRLTEEERPRWIELTRKAASEGKRALFAYTDEVIDGFYAPESQKPVFVIGVERSY
jgi:hypothetical protein